MAARNFLKPRLSSPDDCFSSNMDSPGCGDTDDVSSENDSVGRFTPVSLLVEFATSSSLPA